MRRIVIATGIFPPDIGGPALYSQKLAEEFSGVRMEVSVITYGNKSLKSDKFQISGVSRLWPSGLRQLIYSVKLLGVAKKAEIILAFDSLGAGLPAVIIGKLFGKKVVIRMGGDFLWEKYIESGQGRVTMTEFYEKNLHTSFPILLRLIKFTLQNAYKIAFTTEFQRNLFISAYGLDPLRATVITNVFFSGEKKVTESLIYPADSLKIILWAGRFIKLKNLESLLRVFRRLLINDKNLVLKLIGDGPELQKLKAESRKLKIDDKVLFINQLSQDSIAEEIKKSYFCILPSLSEISPNFALKCLSLNKPIVLTQETGIKKEFPGLMYADPKKEDSFYQSAIRLLDNNSYDNYRKFISNIRRQKTWKDLAVEYLKLSEI